MKNKLFLCLLVTLLLVPSIGFAQTPFTDVENHWAATDIEAVYQKGLMQGITSNQFDPESNITRAEISVCLDRLFKFDYDDKKFIKQPVISDLYDDVEENAWYSDVVLKCGLNGIFNTEDRKFQPNQPVTRIEAGSAIEKSLLAKNLGIITTMMWPVFEDTVNIPAEDQNVVCFMVNARIMQGSDELFRPYDTITRAEFAAILNRTAQTLEHAFPINPDDIN